MITHAHANEILGLVMRGPCKTNCAQLCLRCEADLHVLKHTYKHLCIYIYHLYMCIFVKVCISVETLDGHRDTSLHAPDTMA